MGTVFDVNQTEGGKPPSPVIDELRGDVKGCEAVMGAIRKASRYHIIFADIERGAKVLLPRRAQTHRHTERDVADQDARAAVQELAHSVMHDVEPSRGRASLPDRGMREVQAEDIARFVSS